MHLSIVLAGSLILAVQAATPPAPASREIVYEGKDPRFVLRTPPGYVRVASMEPLASFERSRGREAWERIYVDLGPLDSALDPKAPPPGVAVLRKLLSLDVREPRGIKIAWGNLQIDGLEYRFAREGLDMAGRCAWVPIHPKGVAICVSAPSTLAKDLTPELLALVASLRGPTQWLTEQEASSLRHWQAPAWVVPILSGVFLLVWAVVLRGNPLRLHWLRVAWHAAVPLVAALGWYFVQRSAAAREKMGIETPLLLWLVVILPLAIFHVVMITHRVRMAVEMGD